MFDQLPPLKALRAFEAAARHGSFTEAATELSLTQGAVSYQIRKLESTLNIDLFLRSARRVSLTPQGQSFFRTTHRLFRELEDETLRLAPDRNQLILTISVSTYFVTRWLSQRLGRFLNQNPQITLRLQHSVNDPGFSVEDVDLAIRWGDGEWPRCESKLLIPSPMMAMCSPHLVSGKNPIKQLDDLRQQTFLHDQDGSDRWSEWLTKAGLEDLGSGPGPVIVDPNVRVQSAIDGHGLILADVLIDEAITQGRLLTPFDIQLEGFGFYLIHTSYALRNHACHLFRKWLLDEVDIFNGETASQRSTSESAN